MMNKSFHGRLHLSSGGWNTLGVICSYISGWHLIETLLNDSQTLSHFCHPLQISVIAISIGSDRNIKVNQVVGIIGSSFSNVIFDSCTSEHDPRASPVDGIFR